MRTLNRCPWWALGTAVCLIAIDMAAADESSVAEVAGAAIENPDCVGAAIANQAVQEGLRRGGRQLLNRFGINARQNAAPVPCGEGASASTDSGAQPAAAAPAPEQSPPAAPTRRGGLFGGLRQSATAGQSRRNCGALGAGCADGMTPLVACMNEMSFWGEMAVAVERKRDSGTWTAEQLADINADIAAMRAAHAAGANRVEPVDPARPNRHFDWLTPEEYSAAATATSQKLNAHREECNRKYAHF
ncbi:MAG TPA: hypothetical protein VF339_19265 [Gammaproteobacteria bacterium]